MVVLAERSKANQLKEDLTKNGTPINSCKLIKPSGTAPEDHEQENKDSTPLFQPIEFESVKLLNPKLARQSRQKMMANWLMPFGLLAGLTFSQMTGLQTFSNLGMPNWIEPVLSGLLGMGSGWLGSQFAAGTVDNDNEDDLRSLFKLHQEGKWLMLIETPVGIELPWQILKEVNPIEIMRLSDL